MANLPEDEVFAKTVYAEARGESKEGQEWVAWVIKNRAHKNQGYWGGSTIKGVCLKSNQFECWNGVQDIQIKEQSTYDNIKGLTDAIAGMSMSSDPTGGCDHYLNPKGMKELPAWTRNVRRVKDIGNHVFFKDDRIK